jgi:tetratricopeptide (TPR) repeat protein
MNFSINTSVLKLALWSSFIAAAATAHATGNLPARPGLTNLPPEINSQLLAQTNIGDRSVEGQPVLVDLSTRSNRISNLEKAPEANKHQLNLEIARKFRDNKELKRAEVALIQILESTAPDEFKRPALLELALVMQEQRVYPKAQQLYSEYVRRFDKDPSVPEVHLRQAYLYREMGVPILALSKFYAVISTCLSLKLDDMEYYQKLVLRAQAEIAETFYLQNNFEEAIDYFNRLLRLESAHLQRADILYKLVRCYTAVSKFNEAIASARVYLDLYEDQFDAPETRFLFADALKKLGRNKEAIQEINLLLQKQHETSKTDPQQWLYWQQRAGNEIANQLYREGDLVSALQVYQRLGEINNSPEWQIPVWYQIGLVYENLKQNQKASEMYDRIVERAKVATEATASIKAVADMAAWRKQFLSWEAKAQIANQGLRGNDTL